MIDVPRVAQLHDLAAIEALVADAYRDYIPRIGRKPGPMLDDYGARIRAGEVYVLADGPQVRALLVLINEAPVLLLDNLAVAPACQGQGLGRHLLAFAEQVARDTGCSRLRLYTNEAMTENIALYTRAGFRENQRTHADGWRRVHMSKDLTGR